MLKPHWVSVSAGQAFLWLLESKTPSLPWLSRPTLSKLSLKSQWSDSSQRLGILMIILVSLGSIIFPLVVTNNFRQLLQPLPVLASELATSTTSAPSFQQTSGFDGPITRSTSIDVTGQGERAADVEYWLKRRLNSLNGSAHDYQPTQGLVINTDKDDTPGPDNIISKEVRLIQNGHDGLHTTRFWVGAKKFKAQLVDENSDSNTPELVMSETLRDDENPDFPEGVTKNDLDRPCVRLSNYPVVNRRIGICNDGVYDILMRMTDTAGNSGEIVGRSLERDTVNPAKPEIEAKSNPAEFGLFENLGLMITGEGKTTASIQISAGKNEKSYGQIYARTVSLGNSGRYDTDNLLGTKLLCGKVTYMIKVNLRDRAGNISQESVTSLTTKDCPSCSGSGSSEGFINPINHPQVVLNPANQFRPPGRPDHNGIDVAITGDPDGTIPVVAVASGTVVFAGPDKYNGQFIDIDHQNGYKTRYLHLYQSASLFLKLGDTVTQGQQIGLMGSTGKSSAPHLHFEIHKNGAKINPRDFVYLGGGNVQGEVQKEYYCKASGADSEDDHDHGNGDENYSEDYPSEEEMADIALKEIEINKLENQDLPELSSGWKYDSVDYPDNSPINVDSQSLEFKGKTETIRFPVAQTGKKDANFGTFVLTNNYSKNIDLNWGNFSIHIGPNLKIYQDFYLEDTETGTKYPMKDCLAEVSFMRESVTGDCFLQPKNGVTIPIRSTDYLKTYYLRGTLVRTVKKDWFTRQTQKIMPEEGNFLAFERNMFENTPENLAVKVGWHAGEVADQVYYFNNEDAAQLLAETACITSSVISGGTTSFLVCAGLYTLLAYGQINQDQNTIGIASELAFFAGGKFIKLPNSAIRAAMNKVFKKASTEIGDQAAKEFTEQATRQLVERQVGNKVAQNFAREIQEVGLDGLGKQLAGTGGEAAIENLTRRMIEGRAREEAERSVRDLFKNNSASYIEKTMFETTDPKIINDVLGNKYNTWNKLPKQPSNSSRARGIIYDGFKGDVYYEIKNYTGKVGLTYQLRTEIFLALRENKKFIIVNKLGKSGLTKPLLELLNKYPELIQVETFIT